MTPNRSEEPPHHFIVFIPGYMGSRLRSRSTGELVWLDIPSFVLDPLRAVEKLHCLFERLKYPNADLVPDGILDQLLFLPPLFKQEGYSRILQTLASWGYVVPGELSKPEQRSVYTFAYDWRQDNRLSARQLSQAVAEWRSLHPGAEVWIIAHSNGGIVARWYIENLGGKDVVSRLFLLASPWDGAPKALQVMQEGFDVFLLRIFDRYGLRDLIHAAALTFPSFYQLLPGQIPFLQDDTGNVLDLFKDTRWLESDAQRRMALGAKRFHLALGVKSSVESLCFFGINQPTTSQGVATLTPEGHFDEITWQVSEDGDGTLPVHSAVHPGAREKLPYAAGHGDLYNYRPLLDKLQYELIRRYRYGPAAAAAQSGIKVQFKASQEVYAPAEPIVVRASVESLLTGLPVPDANVAVDLIYLSELFSSVGVQDRLEPGTVVALLTMDTVPAQPGHLRGTITAPLSCGYFTLRAQVASKDAPPIEVNGNNPGGPAGLSRLEAANLPCSPLIFGPSQQLRLLCLG